MTQAALQTTDLTLVESKETLASKQKITTFTEGTEGTFDFRLRFKNSEGDEVSPWHDIGLRPGQQGLLNMVVEIPKMTRHKMEVNTKEPSTPIAQDVKKGKLRDYHGPIFWNYGMFPQTWEDPGLKHPELEAFGDNDPLDAVEIGGEALDMGSIEQVKVLGAFAMLDDGELDWKVICIRGEDPLAQDLHDIGDVEKKCPGVISGIREWFRWYKTPDSKPLNGFGFGELALDRARALEVVAETHEAWQRLREGTADKGKLWLPADKGTKSEVREVSEFMGA